MVRNSIFILAISIFMFSCGGSQDGGTVKKSEQKNLEAELYSEVIEIHDEVMPKMSEINDLKTSMDEQIQTMREDSASLTASQEEYLRVLESTVTQLEEADASMMNWMRSFEPITEEDEHDEVMERLEGEKQEIEKIRDDINSAIEVARGVLSEAGI